MLGSIKGEAIASSAISEDINWGHNLQQSGGEGYSRGHGNYGDGRAGHAGKLLDSWRSESKEQRIMENEP